MLTAAIFYRILQSYLQRLMASLFFFSGLFVSNPEKRSDCQCISETGLTIRFLPAAMAKSLPLWLAVIGSCHRSLAGLVCVCDF